MPSTTDKEYLERITSWFSEPQLNYFRDASKRKISLKCRQIGWTEVNVAEAVYHCATTPNHTFYLVKQTRESAAKELLSRARDLWVPAFSKVPSLTEALKVKQDNVNEIVFANGSRIAALSNNVAKMRGEVASFLFDEIDHWETRQLEALPDAVFPIIDNRLNPECLLRLISTPWVEGRLFQEIWEDEAGSYEDWSRHYIDVYDAVRAGYPIDIDALKRRYKATPERFSREYECKWVSTDYFFFDRSVIAALQSQDPLPEGADVYCGIDVGKKHDFTAVQFLYVTEEGSVAADLYLLRKMSYEKIAEIVSELLIQYGPKKVKVDETNNTAFVDSLKAKTRSLVRDLNKAKKEQQMPDTWTMLEYPDFKGLVDVPKIDGIHMTNGWQSDRIHDLLDRIEKAEIQFNFDIVRKWDRSRDKFISENRHVLLEDISKVVETSTPSGLPRYEVERNEDGHGDSFYALLLALDAAPNRKKSDGPGFWVI